MGKYKLAITAALFTIAFLGYNFLTKERVFYRDAIIILNLAIVTCLWKLEKIESK